MLVVAGKRRAESRSDAAGRQKRERRAADAVRGRRKRGVSPARREVRKSFALFTCVIDQQTREIGTHP